MNDSTLVPFVFGGADFNWISFHCRRYDTSVETLLRHGDNMLSSLVQYRNSMLGGWKGEPGNKEIFIDRNGSRFCYILDYMRDRKLPSFHHIWQYEEILIEANFFQLDGLIRLCQNGIDKLLTKVIINVMHNTISPTTTRNS